MLKQKSRYRHPELAIADQGIEIGPGGQRRNILDRAIDALSVSRTLRVQLDQFQDNIFSTIKGKLSSLFCNWVRRQ